jgi:diguanylate cyclase (GGDEF)-like protein
MATVDSLTGFYVRDYFFTRLEEERERMRRYNGPFALMMIDLDGFKEINDTHGHPAGDRYLREITSVIRAELRGADIACRYGGDEFCLLLPHTDLAGARIIAERIRAAVSARIVAFDGAGLRSTVSIGVAAFPGTHGARGVPDVLRNADRALYKAKRGGRDRVVPYAA